MGIIEIIALVAALTNLSRDLLLQVGQLTDLFKKMNDEGRDKMTPDEELKIVAARDAARAALQAAIVVAP